MAKNDTTPENDSGAPSSWPGLAWRVLMNAKALLSALSVLLIGYVGLRMAGFDVLPPVLAKFGVTTVGRTLDISGSWKYRCTSIGTPFYGWGGTARIRQEVTPYGIQWKLYGQRLWETKGDESGKKTTLALPTPYAWETNWGAITPEPAVRFSYRISTNEGTIEGYAYGDIKETGGIPQTIMGKFYQLPPYKPIHGTLELKRMVNDSDTTW